MKKQINILTLSLIMFLCLMFNYKVVEATAITSEETAAVVNLESYEVEEGLLSPGEQITLHLFVKNNSTTLSVENTVLTMDSANYALLPIYGEDNQVYIGTLAPSQTKEILVKAVVNSNYNTTAAQLNCRFKYLSGRIGLENTATIYIPTYPGGKLVPLSTIVAGNTSIGARTLVSVQYKNASTNDMSDIVLNIEGNIDDANKEIKLPVARAGKVYTNDCYVAFQENGLQKIRITYTYTDENGVKNEVLCGVYQVNVTGSMPSGGSVAVVSGQDESSVVVRVGVLLIVFVISLFMTMMYIKKNK